MFMWVLLICVFSYLVFFCSKVPIVVRRLLAMFKNVTADVVTVPSV